MSYKTVVCCRKCSLLVGFLLLLQAGFSQYNFSKLDAWLANNVNELGGRAVFVIYKDGKIVYSHAENELSARQKRVGKFIAKRQGKDADATLKDFDNASRQRIASSSKWLSAALVMTFADEGALQLEDTIGKFLPVMSAHGKGHITIWQCLSHLTGIASGSLKESLNGFKDIKTMEEAVEKIAALPMEGEPGKTFHYSNTGLQLAAAVIEKISGKNFETLFAERIAGPCNMLHSDFGKGPVALPAGGAWSTANDYINFLQMILQEGHFNGKKVLSKNAVIAMQQNRIAADTKILSSPAEAGNWGYGFGEWVMDNPPLLPAAAGGMPASQRSDAVTSPGLFGSFPWVNNQKQYAGFLMTFNLNSKGRHERYKALKQLVDEALTKQ
jgi:CubicO group peptidase (beta-lactamase class C family)